MCVCVCRLSVSIVRVSSLLNGPLTRAFSDIKADTDARFKSVCRNEKRRLTENQLSEFPNKCKQMQNKTRQ